MHLTFSRSFWEFIRSSDSRIARFIAKMNDSYSCANHYLVLDRKIFTDEHIDFLTFRDDGTISYLPAGKEHIINEDGRWAREGRQNGKPSKVIRKIFTPLAQRLFSDKDFEQFANMYKAAGDTTKMRFEILHRNRIPDVYCMPIERGDGPLNNSCMNGDANYVQLYKYIEGVRILVMYNEGGELAGRALLWDVPYQGSSRTLMDRVYVTKDHYYELFLKYAETEGFMRKVSYRSYDCKDKFTFDGETSFKEYFKFKFTYDPGEYPYIDTFTWGYDNYIMNYDDDYTYEYNCTDGSREDNSDNDEVYDELNGNYIHRDNAVYVDAGRYRGCYIHEEDTVYVEGSHYWSGDNLIVEIDCTWYLKDDCYEIDGEWVHSDDVVYCKYDDENYKKDDCVELHDGEWCKEEDSVEGDDGNIYHKSETIPC